MRIITGSARGKRLQTLEGMNTRPTSEKVKEGLFSAIQFDIEGRKILDLFAGSGQLGLEALSRGAKEATFVDSGKDAMKIIEANISSCGFEKRAKTYRMDYTAFIAKNTEMFDIVFIDPPYQSGFLIHALNKVVEFTNLGGTIVCEHQLGEKLPEVCGQFQIFKEYKYGKIGLTLYRKKETVVED